jgi:hypothetical protein
MTASIIFFTKKGSVMKLSGWLFILGTSAAILILILASIDRDLVGEVFGWVADLMVVAVLIPIALIGLFLAFGAVSLLWELWRKIESKVSKIESVKARRKARHMDLLPKIRERLAQPYEEQPHEITPEQLIEARAWTNEATFEIFERMVRRWTDYWELYEIDGFEKGDITVEVFKERFSADKLRSSELGFLIYQDNETRHWSLGKSDHDLQIYRELWDYDQLSERFVEWFEFNFIEGIPACEPE